MTLRVSALQVRARLGAITILAAVGMVALVGMVAFAVDIGYMAVVRNELQSAADSAALAAAPQLLSRAVLQSGSQSTGIYNARSTAVTFAGLNKGGGVPLSLDRNDANLPDGDVVIGYIGNPSNPGAAMDLIATTRNSIQVHVRRDGVRNGPLHPFFARIFGKQTQSLDAQATATVEGGIKGFKFRSNGSSSCKLLPFALNINVWRDHILNGNGQDAWSYNPANNSYSATADGIKETKLFPNKGQTPGNFGTIDIGGSNNSTADIKRQILNGPDANDLAHFSNGVFALDATGILQVNGDTGISAGFESELLAIRGQPRIIPLYQSVTGNGNNAVFTLVGFAGVVITDVSLNGSQNNKQITIQPEFVIDSTAIGGGSTSTSYYVYKGVSLSR